MYLEKIEYSFDFDNQTQQEQQILSLDQYQINNYLYNSNFTKQRSKQPFKNSQHSQNNDDNYIFNPFEQQKQSKSSHTIPKDLANPKNENEQTQKSQNVQQAQNIKQAQQEPSLTKNKQFNIVNKDIGNLNETDIDFITKICNLIQKKYRKYNNKYNHGNRREKIICDNISDDN
jgi:hypothetical protein